MAECRRSNNVSRLDIFGRPLLPSTRIARRRFPGPTIFTMTVITIIVARIAVNIVPMGVLCGGPETAFAWIRECRCQGLPECQGAQALTRPVWGPRNFGKGCINGQVVTNGILEGKEQLSTGVLNGGVSYKRTCQAGSALRKKLYFVLIAS